jgi:2-polyprenyl-3-methyl-5-hydroxy-6-metoxy-1,4-benzoquinol methylase
VLGDEQVAELILGLLPPGGTVLDVGCGGGHTLRALARRGVEGVGIDPHPHGTPCRHLRAEQIGTLEEQFDLVYTLHALHEFDRPDRFPREVKGLLRPGGTVLIMDWLRGAKTGVHEKYFATETVAGWIVDAGFHILLQEVRGQTMILAGQLPVSREDRELPRRMD